MCAEGVYEKKECQRCGVIHFEYYKTCETCRAKQREAYYRSIDTPLKKAKLRLHQKAYRQKKHKDPVAHAKHVAQTKRWRINNPDAVQKWKRKERLWMMQERLTLEITSGEQRFWSKLVTLLFKAGVEWNVVRQEMGSETTDPRQTCTTNQQNG